MFLSIWHSTLNEKTYCSILFGREQYNLSQIVVRQSKEEIPIKISMEVRVSTAKRGNLKVWTAEIGRKGTLTEHAIL